MKNISRNTLKAFTAAALAAMLSTTAHAQLVAYSFTTSNNDVPVAPLYGPTETGTAPATYSAGDLGYGPGLGVDAQFGLMANTPDDSTLAEAVTDQAYFEFTVTPNIGSTLNLTSVDFSGARFTENTAGPTNVVLESSATGSQDLGTFTINGLYTTNNGTLISLPSSDFSDLTAPTTFYLYLYEGSAESAGFFDADPNRGGPVLINGTVEANVPEPGTYALLGLGLGVLVLIVRRRHDAKV